MRQLKVYLRTYGCQMNERDSENVAAQFIERGHIVVDNEFDADVFLMNTCSVREQAELKAIGKLRYVVARKNRGLPITGVFGCMAQNRGQSLFKLLPELDIVAGTWHTPNLVDFVEKCYNERVKICRLDSDAQSHNKIYRHLPTPTKNPTAYISIMQGCSMKCSYCIVPFTRGEERSRPIDDIVKEATLLAERGVKEICLLGQVVNAYGRKMPIGKDGASPFVQLLRKLNDIPQISRIRFTSPHPSFFRDDLIKSYGSLEKLCECVHLPIQSGSDEILKRMKRPYRIDMFKRICDSLRAQVPVMSISTDVIVGYPQESRRDFEMTKEAFEYCDFDMAYIFKYSPRKGTPSALEKDDIPEDEKENRNQELLKVLEKQSIAFNEKLVGTTQEVLFEAAARRGEGVCMGRTRTHRKVFAKISEQKIGEFANVKIQSASVSALTGEVVQP